MLATEPLSGPGAAGLAVSQTLEFLYVDFVMTYDFVCISVI